MNLPLSPTLQASLEPNLSGSTLNGVQRPTPFDQPFNLSSSSSAGTNRSIAFIDSSLNDYEVLVSALQPGTEVVILNSAQSGLQQVQSYLAGKSNIASLQIFSHGQIGGFQLGNDLITTANADLLQSWASSLTDDADILVYGCDVAQGELGQAFIQILSQVTGADIAASNDLTGSANLGGDWVLEYQAGEIDLSLAARSTWLQTYDYILPVFSNTAAIAIPNSGTATPYPSTISVSGLGSSISAITVTLTNMSHTFPADVDILLVGPTGAGLILMSDVGGGTDIVSVTLTFSDAAATGLPATIVTGTYRPTNTGTGDSFPEPAPVGSYTTALSTFIGTNPNGDWRLFVVDDLGGDAGTIAGGWSLDITAITPNTAPVLDTSGNPALPNVSQDATNPNGVTIFQLISSLGGTGITDTDTGALRGIAVTGVNNSNGTWQYSPDGGSTWVSFGAVSTTNARLLADNSTTRVRFVPNAGFNGTVTQGISFRAWDQTSGTNGSTANTTVNGGASAFSVNIETAGITIDAPPPVVIVPPEVVIVPPAVVIVPPAEVVVVTTAPPSIFKTSKKGKSGIKIKVKKQKFRRKKR
ncbi:DUF4347 domain-containing protein [Pantanalinema rosaneae CENA516]|uniref:DUF4347 domain-containing protein n=1 Tax=Pantanalinema rosaneae TaxID=1620701 RepID=UPI003D700E68